MPVSQSPGRGYPQMVSCYFLDNEVRSAPGVSKVRRGPLSLPRLSTPEAQRVGEKQFRKLCNRKRFPFGACDECVMPHQLVTFGVSHSPHVEFLCAWGGGHQLGIYLHTSSCQDQRPFHVPSLHGRRAMRELTTDSPWEMWSEPFAPTGNCPVELPWTCDIGL